MMASYTVHLCPPDYPDRCFPARCRHPPQLGMVADVRLVPKKGGGRTIEIAHAVCLGCGLPTPRTYGGNVLVDLTMIMASDASLHWKIGQRAQVLRNRWARIATYLFDEKGWNGRHVKIARLIDPMLTMRLSLHRTPGGETRMASISFDPSYLRGEVDAQRDCGEAGRAGE